jgi:hypothetical protein
MVGCRHDHGVDLFAFKQLSKIADPLSIASDQLPRLFRAPVVGIANGADSCPRLEELTRHILPASTAANQSQHNSVVSACDLTVAGRIHCLRAKISGNSRHAQPLNKITT